MEKYKVMLYKKNEDTNKVKEIIINKINHKYIEYKKNKFMCFSISLGEYPLADIERRWLDEICKYKLGECEVIVESDIIEPFKFIIKVISKETE